MAERAYDPVSLSTLSFWTLTPQERDERFAVLRDDRPVSWQPPAEGALIPQPEGSGFWAVVRHADIQQVSKDPQTFCSGRGVMLDNVPDVVSSAFTPRQVTRIEEQIHHRARRIVDWR